MQAELYYSLEQAVINLYLNHKLEELEKLNEGEILKGSLKSFAESTFQPEIFNITLKKIKQRYDFNVKPKNENKRWATDYLIEIG